MNTKVSPPLPRYGLLLPGAFSLAMPPSPTIPSLGTHSRHRYTRNSTRDVYAPSVFSITIEFDAYRKSHALYIAVSSPKDYKINNAGPGVRDPQSARTRGARRRV